MLMLLFNVAVLVYVIWFAYSLLKAADENRTRFNARMRCWPTISKR